MSYLIFTLCLLTAATAMAQVPRITFADIFTNSHCGPCATMHDAVDRYITSTERADNVIIVYHHIRVYADDPIYQANEIDPTDRARYYGQVLATPTVFFNGRRWNGPYSAWPQAMDTMTASSPVAITLTPTADPDSVYVDVRVSASTSIAGSMLYVGLVEDVRYRGRNGVEKHDGVLRAAFTAPAGVAVDVNPAEATTIRFAVQRRSLWDLSKCRIVAAVSDATSKAITQAAQAALPGTSTVAGPADTELVTEAMWFTLDGQLVQSALPHRILADVLAGGAPAEFPSGVAMLYVRTATGASAWRSIIHMR
jgi:Outer membrane protein Omp28